MSNVRRMMQAAAGAAGGGWTQVGNTQTLGSVPSMTGLTSTTAAKVLTNALRTYSFNGTTWSQTGNSLTLSGTDNHAIVALSSTRIAMVNSGTDVLGAYDWGGTNWTQTGSLYSSFPGTYPGMGAPDGIARLSASRIALVSKNGDLDANLTAYDFSGSSWSKVGNSLTVYDDLSSASACALSSTRIVTLDNTQDKLIAYDFNGTNWSVTGNALTGLTIAYGDVCRLSSTQFALYYAVGFSAQSYINRYSFDGTNFALVEPSYSGITAAYTNKIAYLGTVGADSNRVVTYAGTATSRTFDWVAP